MFVIRTDEMRFINPYNILAMYIDKEDDLFLVKFVVFDIGENENLDDASEEKTITMTYRYFDTPEDAKLCIKRLNRLLEKYYADSYIN